MPKILLGVDLDYTHFLSHKDGIHWIGSELFWKELYQELNDQAAAEDIEVVFAVVTHKDQMDELAFAAALAFREFLIQHNKDMFIEEDGTWLLINFMGKLQYDYVDPGWLDINVKHPRRKQRPVPSQRFSHFEISPLHNKSEMLRRVASHHGIPIQSVLFLDDTPEVIEELAQDGIQTVSFECFHGKTIEIRNCLEDPDYIETNLHRIKNEIKTKFTQLLQKVKAQPQPSIPFPAVTVSEGSHRFTPLFQSQRAIEEALLKELSQFDIGYTRYTPGK